MLCTEGCGTGWRNRMPLSIKYRPPTPGFVSCAAYRMTYIRGRNQTRYWYLLVPTVMFYAQNTRSGAYRCTWGIISHSQGTPCANWDAGASHVFHEHSLTKLSPIHFEGKTEFSTNDESGLDWACDTKIQPLLLYTSSSRLSSDGLSQYRSLNSHYHYIRQYLI